MFGIDDAILWPALFGAASSALGSKKPLESALTGGALGAASGGLLGGANPAALAVPETQAGLLAAQEAGLGANALGWGGATTGVQGGLNSTLGTSTGSKVGGLLSDADKIVSVAKPIGQAVQTANMFVPDEREEMMMLPPTITPQIPQNGPKALSEIAGIGQQASNMIMDEAKMRREKQRQRTKMMGGY